LQTYSCSFQTDSTDILGSTSYRDALAVEAKVSGGGWGFAFSASTDFSQIRESTSRFHRVYIASVAKCSLYVARIKQLTAVNLSPIFVAAVQDLPSTRDDEAYLEFISVFRDALHRPHDDGLQGSRDQRV
jgi:hypothetical protein